MRKGSVTLRQTLLLGDALNQCFVGCNLVQAITSCLSETLKVSTDGMGKGLGTRIYCAKEKRRGNEIDL